MNSLEIVSLEADMAPELAQLELACFPTTNPDDLLSEEDIRAYAVVFPQGYFVAMVDRQPVGMGAGIYVNFDFENPQHTLAEASGENQCGKHISNGRWYYGTDISVHPEFRGRGIGRSLYQRRKNLVISDEKRGIIAGGSLPGFSVHKANMSVETYVDRVVAGDLFDPTLSFQLANGFEVRGILESYVEDASEDGWATLIVWERA